MRPRISASKKTLDELRRRVKVAATAGNLTIFRKATAILLALEGNTFESIAKAVSSTAESVGIWLQQFYSEAVGSADEWKVVWTAAKVTKVAEDTADRRYQARSRSWWLSRRVLAKPDDSGLYL